MFDQLAGNQRVKDLLRRMLESRRVPGALLFSGEEGVGKKLFALELAKALNCRSPRGIEACDECASCKRVPKINFPTSDDTNELRSIFWTDHPDVGLVQPPGRVFHVIQMRQIEREANYRPFEGAARFFLIDEADKFNDASANALLKILEEPPRTSHLILITARPAALLPTIRSRCQVVQFAPLSTAEIETFLLQSKAAKSADAHLRARIAAGSIGRALANDVSDYEAKRAAMLGVLECAALTGDRAGLLKAAESLSSSADKKDKEAYEISLDILEGLIRDVMIVSIGANDALVVNDDLRPKLAAIAARVDGQHAARWISQIEELREQLVVNINRKVATDALLLSMAVS